MKGLRGFPWVLVHALIAACGQSSAFVRNLASGWTIRSAPLTSTQIMQSAYRDDAFASGGGTHNPRNATVTNQLNLNQDTPGVQQPSLNKQSVKQRGKCVPVVGPLVNAPPLLVGDSMAIDQPTPLQWQALYESVLLHQEYMNLQRDQTDSSSGGADSNNGITGIDAAPLIAIIDEATGSTSGNTGRYATLAAIVGISPSSRRNDEECDVSDMDNEISFLDSFSGNVPTTSIQRPLESCIRLVGIGRAQLRDYFYKLPTEESSNGDDEISNEKEEDEASESDDDHPVELSDDPPIIMAEFDMLVDDLQRHAENNDIGMKGASSSHASPVHALNDMSTIHNKLLRLHNERLKLVRGCTAAKFRLERRDYYEDLDGIGQVTSSSTDADDDDMVLQNFVREYNFDTSSHDGSTKLDPSVLLELENYGISTYSSMSSLIDLTDVAMQQLAPYYSPSTRQEEEFRYVVNSFVCFRALHGWCGNDDLAWALQCTNTIERLHRAHEIMDQHTALLTRMAEQLTHDLRECGEECTDLW